MGRANNLKRKFFLLLISVLLPSLLFACSSNGAKKIKVQEMISFSKEKKDSAITITDSEKVKTIETAIREAKRQDGIADMSDPQYRIDIGKDSYYLWFHDDESATIMNSKDTHTIFKINDAQNLRAIINNN